MTTVTAASIKSTIDAALVTSSITGVSVFDHARPDKRKIFPSIEITPTSAEQSFADHKITNISQGFNIILRIKPRGSGTDDVALQKSIEDSILPAITFTALGQTRLHILNKTWQRPNALVQKPVPHLQSNLIVLITTDTSTTGSGQLLSEMTVDFPSLAGMELLSKPTENEIEIGESIKNDTNNRVEFGSITDLRQAFFEVEYTDARMSTLRAQRTARAKITVTLHRTSGDDVMTGKISSVNHGAVHGDVETVIIGFEVF